MYQINCFNSAQTNNQQSFDPSSTNDQQQSLLECLPKEILHTIIAEVETSKNQLKNSTPSGLDVLALASKNLHKNVGEFKELWQLRHANLNKQADFVKNITSAEEAVDFIINHNPPLEVADLSNCQDLDDEQLEMLMNKCTNIKHLIIKSAHITKLPASCNRLLNLNCSSCENLASLP